MADFGLIVKNGTVVTASDTFAGDIGVRDGPVATLAENLAPSGTETVIDGSGKLVLPGGVEAHCHFDEPSFGGATLADDFASGSVATARGGTTTFIPFANQVPGQPLCQAAGEPHFRKINPGVPGIELRLPLMFSEGVNRRRIDLNRFVGLTATEAAKLYGLCPQKSTIAVGSDADLALWDADRQTTVHHAMLHDGADYTPYEDFELTGWPVLTLSRGVILWQDGRVHGEPGRGRFLKRGTSAAISSYQVWST